jgi:hypothetical protein
MVKTTLAAVFPVFVNVCVISPAEGPNGFGVTVAGTDAVQLNIVLNSVPGTSDAKWMLTGTPPQTVWGEEGVATRSGNGLTMMLDNIVGDDAVHEFALV